MVVVQVQFAVGDAALPTPEQISAWACAAFDVAPRGELTVRVVGLDEAKRLNESYRHIDEATNVLSFSADWESEEGVPYYGDIAICAEVVRREAETQGKTLFAHWAHMVVHGALHLLGHDHQLERDAEAMEAREKALLAQFGFGDPYESDLHLSPLDRKDIGANERRTRR